jgi:hypothetical protein
MLVMVRFLLYNGISGLLIENLKVGHNKIEGSAATTAVRSIVGDHMRRIWFTTKIQV